MPFPESERVVYRKNPLVQVIGQLRFPTILRIGVGQLADFQDKIRGEYPLYSLQEPSFEFPQLPKELSSVLEQLNLPKPPGLAIHRFSTGDSQRFVSLCQDFLALTELRYLKWELFRKELEKAEKAIREVYNPAFYYRIGLRYRDVISRRNLGLTEEKWQALLQPHIVGELGTPEVSDAIVVMQTQSIIKTNEVPGGQVKFTHGLVRSPGTDEECYMIDADFSVEKREGLNAPFEILDKFNRLAGRLFRWAITDTLHRAMEPESI